MFRKTFSSEVAFVFSLPVRVSLPGRAGAARRGRGVADGGGAHAVTLLVLLLLGVGGVVGVAARWVARLLVLAGAGRVVGGVVLGGVAAVLGRVARVALPLVAGVAGVAGRVALLRVAARVAGVLVVGGGGADSRAASRPVGGVVLGRI